ncbi:TadE family type IV pilus minor pilin [Microbacterium sp. X-17]|uniref:TadE family type IV pilus minor pilin n=1 Tax=Microbacterium sp. X-17 TaxID=3144404 RepID=UPI0031F527FE
MRLRGDDRGSVTAEFAVVLPAVLVVLLIGVGALSAAGRAVQLQDAAADAARLAGRGEADAAAATVARAVPGARAAVEMRGDLVCVTATVAAPVLPLLSVLPPLAASACALAGGR